MNKRNIGLNVCKTLVLSGLCAYSFGVIGDTVVPTTPAATTVAPTTTAAPAVPATTATPALGDSQKAINPEEIKKDNEEKRVEMKKEHEEKIHKMMENRHKQMEKKHEMRKELKTEKHKSHDVNPTINDINPIPDADEVL